MDRALEPGMVTRPLTKNNRLRVALLIVALVCTSEISSAQRGLGPERADINNFRGDIWSVWTSPAGMRQRDVVSIAATLGAGVLTSRIDSSAYVWMRTHPRSLVMRLIAPIRDSASLSIYEFGSGQYLLPFSAILYTAGRLSHSTALRDAGLGCAAGHLASVGLRQVAMHSIGRARPTLTADPFEMSVPGSSDWERESFYSGHISNSMACASFMTHRFDLGLATPLPYIFSGAIGVGRLADGHHWPSDMVVGGIIGFAVGKAIANRAGNRNAVPVAPGGALAHRIPWEVPVMQWSLVF